MDNRIRVIQLGKEDFSRKYQIHPSAQWMYEPSFSELPAEEVELVIIDRRISKTEKTALFSLVKVGALLILEDVLNHKNLGVLSDLYYEKCGEKLKRKDLESFLLNDIPDYFDNQYGEKFNQDMFCIAFGFDGDVIWEGNEYISLTGKFGEAFCQIGYWRGNIPIKQGQTLEIWMEYEKDESVELSMEATLLETGQLCKVVKVYKFNQTDINDIMYIKNDYKNCHIFFSLKAKGEGNLKIKALHNRYSRNGKAVFIPGGQRFVTKKREEIFYYFNPGNLKPPLNVYFSGYKTMEGFEGYKFLKKLGSPFLLISDERLEGGAFYLGDEEYEMGMVAIIESVMKILGFGQKQVIMSGIAMGSFGALYYGSFIMPHTILVGNPLVNLGDVAENEHLIRPGGFPTSIDVVKKHMRQKHLNSSEEINQYFWKAFEKADYSNTNFAVAYMLEDDYDMNAYRDLQEHLHDSGVTIYGKGIHGRHNDATNEIIKWFLNQYKSIIDTEFNAG